MTTCPLCHKRPKKVHANAKWCGVCARKLVKKPRSNMTPAQVSRALRLRGKLKREEVARRVGVSAATIGRLGRELGLSFASVAHTYRAAPGLIEAVTAYYSKHGKVKTQKKFPNVKIRSIVERYPCEPRQIRWTDDQIVDAARMAGLIPMARQAKIFNRPNARVGSIRSLWVKRMKMGGGSLHGLRPWQAQAILRPGYPVIRMGYWNRRCNTNPGPPKVRALALWCDIEPWILEGTPAFIREGIRAMAQFQRWLYRTQNPRRAILALLRKGNAV